MISTRSSKASTANEVELRFQPSKHIFDGIAEIFPNVKILWIDKQKIKFVERGNFAGLLNLELLALSSNQIEFLPKNVFSEIPNLKTLGLSNNQIKHFPANVFGILKNLEELWTDGNPASTNKVLLSHVPDLKLMNETASSYYQRGAKFE
jgi:Leucine-rich repeat (LRR) protein